MLENAKNEYFEYEKKNSRMCIFYLVEVPDRNLSSSMSASTPHNYRPAPRPHLHHRQPRPRAPLKLPISLYADRFGIKSPGRSKSWLTPLDPLFPRNWENDQHGDSSKLLGDYQKSQLFCFTTRELKDLDAICDRPVKESTLTGGIMPLLRRDRWEDKPSTAWLRRESIPIVS